MADSGTTRRYGARLQCVWKEGRIEEWKASVEPPGPRGTSMASPVAAVTVPAAPAGASAIHTSRLYDVLGSIPPPAARSADPHMVGIPRPGARAESPRPAPDSLPAPVPRPSIPATPVAPRVEPAPAEMSSGVRRSTAPIVLLTDFGTRDTYVGIVKGVLAGLAPNVPVIDLTHDVPPQDIRTASFLLAAAAPYFPDGTVFVAVVDPGVGTARKLVAVRTDRHVFLAPDNGLLGFLRTSGVIRAQVEIVDPKFFLPDVSGTFHARDILAPAAAHIALGTDVARLGPVLTELKTLSFPRPVIRNNGLVGEVVYVDAYGNAITNLTRSDLDALSRDPLAIRIEAGGQTFAGVRSTYGDVAPGTPVALIGSSGHLELAVSCGHAARAFALAVGAPVMASK